MIPKTTLQHLLAEKKGLARTDSAIMFLTRTQLEHQLKTFGVDLNGENPPPPSPPTSSGPSIEELTKICEGLILKHLGTTSQEIKQDLVNVLNSIRPKETVITVKDEEKIISTTLPQQHYRFEMLLKLTSSRQNVLLVGPAGSGKTTAAHNVAKALHLPFFFNGAIDSEYKLLGFTDANGKIVSRPFREAFINGGVYLFDEVDASYPSAVLAFNAALANKMADFPDGCHPAHKDFICIAAANTFYGADHQYVGRNKQDGAFLDRFLVIEWGYDTSLEASIALSCHTDAVLCDDWHTMILKVREEAAQKGLQIVVSPRATAGGLIAMTAGLSWDEAVEVSIRKTMKADDWSKIEPATKRPRKQQAVVSQTKTTSTYGVTTYEELRKKLYETRDYQKESLEQKVDAGLEFILKFCNQSGIIVKSSGTERLVEYALKPFFGLDIPVESVMTRIRDICISPRFTTQKLTLKDLLIRDN
jgi:cobaltochelatase CobS